MSLGLGLGLNLGSQLAFSPRIVNDLSLWLDASDLSTITSAAGAVSQLNDKSGNGNHAVQSTGYKQPTTGSATINGKNVLSFDGSDYLELPSSLFSIPNGNSTLFAVSTCEGGSGFGAILNGTEVGGSRYGLRYEIAESRMLYFSHTGAVAINRPLANMADPAIFVGERVRQGLIKLWVNGGEPGVGTTSSAEDGVDAMMVGAGAGSNRLYGKIAEIIIFKRALSEAEINRVGRYLSQKWGITWTDV